MNKILSLILCLVIILAVNSYEKIPAAASVKITQFRVEDFGGKADGKTDNMPAMRKLLAKVQYTGGRKIILFGKGTYRFVPADQMHAISVTGVSDLEIIGQGPDVTKIIIGNSHSGFLNIKRSKNVAAKNFSVDHDPLPFTQGTIVAVDPGKLTYDLKIDDGFGIPTEEWFTAEANVSYAYRTSHIMDPETGGFMANTVNNVFVDRETVDLGNRVYRFKSSASGFLPGLGKEAWSKGQIKVGIRMVVLSRACGAHNLLYDSCHNTSYENINVYSSTGFAVMNSGTTGTAAVKNINIKRKEGRMISLCSDGINFTACRAKPLVENCYIEANCDDSISGQAGAPTISKAESSKKFFVQNVDFAKPMKGDRVALYNQRIGKMLGETKIKEVSEKTVDGYGHGFWITLDKSIEGVKPDKNPSVADLMMNPEFTNSGITIKNTTIAVKAGRGVFLHSQDILIENCRFIDIGGQALMLANEGPSRTNGYTRNIVIRNNTFINNAFCEKVWDMWAPIHIGTLRGFYPDKGDKTMYISAREPISDNIRITNNTIKNSAGSYIYLSAVKNGIIEGNTLVTENGYPVLENDALIIADNCSNILVKGNKVSDKRKGLKAVVEARGNTSKGISGIKLSSNYFNCTSGAADLK